MRVFKLNTVNVVVDLPGCIILSLCVEEFCVVSSRLPTASLRETGASLHLSLAATHAYKMADFCLPAVSLSQDGVQSPFDAHCLPSAL